jgi:hypothetical protein
MVDTYAKCISIQAGMSGGEVATNAISHSFASMAVFVPGMVRTFADANYKTTHGGDATGCVRK